MAGRKPKPTELKKLQGNPGKRALNKNEPQPNLALPDCPAELSQSAKTEWQRMAQALFDLGLLTQVDRASLAIYCQSYDNWIEAINHLNTDGMVYSTDTGFQRPSPWHKIADMESKTMRAFATEFGLTPSSRGRISVPGAGEDDEFDDFLSKK